MKSLSVTESVMTSNRTMARLLVTSVLMTMLIVTCRCAEHPESIEKLLAELKYMENLEEKEHIHVKKEEDEEGQRTLCEAYVTNELMTDTIPDEEFAKDVSHDLVMWNDCMQYWVSLQAYAVWDYETDITDGNQEKEGVITVNATRWLKAMSRNAQKYYMDHRYDSLSEDHRRQIRLLQKNAAPLQDEDVKQLQMTLDKLEDIYASASLGKLKLEPDLTKIMAKSRDPWELLVVWAKWRVVTGPKMKSKYAILVELLNKGARENGYQDYGDAWRDDQFDSTPDLESLCDTLWEELRPLYVQVHTYVRKKLRQFYGPQWVDKDSGIPAHLLGNMWAQNWENIYNIVDPFPKIPEPDYDQEMLKQGYDVEGMFSLAEEFYTSLGLPGMTEKFKSLSMKKRPTVKKVVCHASATDFYSDNDFRIKMCTEVNMEYLETVHHEMGHVEYFMAYKNLPMVYRNSANSGFHEAIGDTASLSVQTRKHLTVIGLREKGVDTGENKVKGQGVPKGKYIDPSDIKYLMRKALLKLAFLPFGYLVDKWRWNVFRGNITEENYNTEWWRLRNEIQGIVAPIDRSENDFDPGAKFHIPSNSPYMNYFISFVVQFQFYEALCNASGHQGELYNCDFYNSKEAGDKLMSMLALGKSRPWPEALEKMTGSTEVSASSINKYFAPLVKWLTEENKGETLGWTNS